MMLRLPVVMPSRLRFRRFVLVSALLLAAAAPAAADYVFMLDGHTLHGKLKKEGDLIADVGQDIWAPKVGWVMDDGVRRVYFHQRLVAQAQQDPPEAKSLAETFTLKQPRNPFMGSFQAISLDRTDPWQKKGLRTVEMQARAGVKQKIEQYISLVTPTMIRASARIHRWDMPLLPSEIQPDDLFMVLRSHDDALGKEPDSFASKMRMLKFSIEANWLDEADKIRAELVKAESDQANLKLVEKLGMELDRLLAFRADQQIQLAAKAGQHLRAQQLLDAVKDEAASDAVLTRLRSARSRYKQQNAELEALRRLLTQTRRNAKGQALLTAAKPALDEMEQHLNLDTSSRLEVFLKLAQQEDKLKTQAKPSEHSSDQLLALAVTGWLLGAKGAEAKEPYAIQLCDARAFLLLYLREERKDGRDKLLYQFTRGATLRVDEIAQLLENLPPLEPGPNGAGAPKERVTPKTENWPRGVRYQLRRPSEYHPHRSYPLLVVLPNTNPVASNPAELLDWYGPLADRYGYLLAIPDWANVGQGTYKYTPQEMAAVQETIRDVRRRDSVDGERIALAGFDQSAIMAYDVALSRPDQFAAAVAICGKPGDYARNLQNNAQYLPFYLVDGEKDYDRPKETRKLFDYWLGRGFPSLYCEYFSRGYEDYRHELPCIFDWLSRKKVAKGLPDLGQEAALQNLGQPMRCVRPSDQRLYWLTTTDHGGTPRLPAELYARQLAGNSIEIKANRFRKLSVWLSPAMVDFEQPVEIKINPGAGERRFKQAVKPSLETMLEDFRDRGDRRSLYFAKVDFDFTKK